MIWIYQKTQKRKERNPLCNNLSHNSEEHRKNHQSIYMYALYINEDVKSVFTPYLQCIYFFPLYEKAKKLFSQDQTLPLERTVGSVQR